MEQIILLEYLPRCTCIMCGVPINSRAKYCHDCKAVYLKQYKLEYYKKNKPRLSALQKEGYIKNRDIILARDKAYRKKNIERIMAYDRFRYKRDKEKIKERAHLNYIINRDARIKKRMDKYYKSRLDGKCIDCGNAILPTSKRCNSCSSKHKLPHYGHTMSEAGRKRLSMSMVGPFNHRFGKHISEEHKAILRQMCGPIHPRWKGGRSYFRYTLEFNRAFKEHIKELDKRKCVVCGRKQDELNRALCVHHIDYDKKHTTDDNCVAVCSYCHGKTNTKKNEWIELFTKYISTGGRNENEGRVIREDKTNT